MKKFLILFILLSFLNSCQSVSDGFKLKKKDNADEFLVEKKNPLVLPPDYNELPTPGTVNSTNEQKSDSFKSTIIKSEDTTNKKNKTKSLSTQDSILKNIKKDEIN